MELQYVRSTRPLKAAVPSRKYQIPINFYFGALVCTKYLNEPQLITGIVGVIHTIFPILSEERGHGVIICRAESKWITKISIYSSAHEKIE